MAFLISPEKIIGENGFYTFRKQVFLTDSNSNKAVISIFASSRYILHINGKYICEGPCRGTQYVKYYDEITTDEFKDGVNEITVKVLFTPAIYHGLFVAKACFGLRHFTRKRKNCFRQYVGMCV